MAMMAGKPTRNSERDQGGPSRGSPDPTSFEELLGKLVAPISGDYQRRFQEFEEDLVKFLNSKKGICRGEEDKRHWYGFVRESAHLYKKFEREL